MSKKIKQENANSLAKHIKRKRAKKDLTLDDTITTLSDPSIPRRFRNPMSQRWDDTTWT